MKKFIRTKILSYFQRELFIYLWIGLAEKNKYTEN